MTKKIKKHIQTSNCTDAQHHQHVRLKRLSSRKTQITYIDKLVFVAGPMIPIAIVPTVYNVWINSSVQGIALPTWIILAFTSFIMAVYAILHVEKALILTYVPLFLLNVAVVAGVIIKS